MSDATDVAETQPPRLRMFAGPNGSGKTTVKNGLRRPPDWFGTYINADDIEKSLRQTERVSLRDFDLHATGEEVNHFFTQSALLRDRNPTAAKSIDFKNEEIHFAGNSIDSYVASVVADFLRRKMLELRTSFSFETVMSSPDKVHLLRDASASGYRTYLYFVATEDPEINIARVAQRVAEGGHDVPTDKIVARYHRSLALLPEAIQHAGRAFLFDTSEAEPKYVAEITGASKIELKCETLPNWLQTVWKSF